MTERILKVGIDPSKAESGARRAASAMGKVKKEAKGAADSVKHLGNRFDKAKKEMFSFKGAIAGLGLGLLAREIFKIASSFEQYRIQLETVTGSQLRANKAFEGIKDFARNTPFEVKNLTEAFIQLKAVGIEPTTRLMKSLGDTAAAFGKDITQFANTVVKATTGEFESLKTFGIIARNMGDEIKFITRSGTDFVKNNSAAIKNYLRDFSEANFGGAMEKQVDTALGAVSNLSDAFSDLIDKIATRGPLDIFADTIRSLTKGVGWLAENMTDLALAFEIAAKASLGLIALQLPTYILAVTTAVKAFTVALLTNPIGLLLTTIGLIVTGLISFRDMLQDVTKNTITLSDVATAAWQMITDALDPLLTKMQGFIDLLVKAKTAVVGFVKDVGSYINEKTGLGDAFQEASDKAGSLIEQLATNTDKIAAVRIATEALEESVRKKAEADAEATAKIFDTELALDKQNKAMQQRTDQLNKELAIMDDGLRVLDLQARGRKVDAELLKEQIRLSKDFGRELEQGEIQQIRRRIEKQEELNTKLEAQNELTKNATDAAGDFHKPFIDAAERIQKGFADVFTSVFENGVSSFKDMAGTIKSAFARMLGEMATIAIQRQIIIPMVGAVSGAFGAGASGSAVAQSLGGGGGGFSALGGLANFGGGFSGIGATISGGINTFGASLGFGGATPSFVGPMPAGAGIGANAGAITSASLTSVLGAAGLGYMGGSILGGIGGNEQNGGIGGAIGAGIGMAVGGPLGAIIGGALGGLVGGFVGGGEDYPFARADIGTVDGAVGVTGGAVLDAGPAGQINAAAQMVAASVNQFGTLLGATGVTSTGGNIGFSSGHFLEEGYFGGGATGLGSIEEAMERSIIDLISKASFAGISPELSTAINRAAGTEGANLESILQDFAFAKSFLDGTLFDPDSMTQAEQAIAALNAQFAETAATASRLGLSLETVETERLAAMRDMVIGFNDDIQKQILAFTDPLQLQMDALIEAQEQRVKEAAALGADLVEVERLGAMEREAVLRNFNSTLQQLMDDLTIGGGGIATPAERLAQAEALFGTTAAAAEGGSGAARGELAAISRTFLEASEAFFGSSSGYIEDFNQVTNLLSTLLGDTPRFAAGGITSGLSFAGEAGPEAVVPLSDGRSIPVSIGGNFASSIVDEIRRLSQLMAANSSKDQNIQEAQAAEIRDLNQKLERLVSNVQAGGY